MISQSGAYSRFAKSRAVFALRQERDSTSPAARARALRSPPSTGRYRSSDPQSRRDVARNRRRSPGATTSRMNASRRSRSSLRCRTGTQCAITRTPYQAAPQMRSEERSHARPHVRCEPAIGVGARAEKSRGLLRHRRADRTTCSCSSSASRIEFHVLRRGMCGSRPPKASSSGACNLRGQRDECRPARTRPPARFARRRTRRPRRKRTAAWRS